MVHGCQSREVVGRRRGFGLVNRFGPHCTKPFIDAGAVRIFGVLTIRVSVLVRDHGLQVWLTFAIFAFFLFGLLSGLLRLIVSARVPLWLLTIVGG